MLSGSRLTNSIWKTCLAGCIAKRKTDFIVTVMLKVTYILKTYLSCFPVWTGLNVFTRHGGSCRTCWNFSGFWAGAVVHYLRAPFRTEALILQLPRATGSWKPTAESLARTRPWLKGYLTLGLRPFPGIESSDWSMRDYKYLVFCPQYRTTLKDHLRFRIPPSPNKISQGLCCDCITVQLLPLPSSAFLFSYRFCSERAIQQTPCIHIPISESFQEAWLKTDSFILLATSYESTM